MGGGGKKKSSAPAPAQTSEYTRYAATAGDSPMSESDYYADKQAKQTAEFQNNLTRQQQEFQQQLAESQQKQTTLLTQQKQEVEAAQQAAYLKDRLSTRDSLFTERTDAEGASVDYINTQIAREKSNAALFGMEYKLSDEDKASRVADYFSSIWSAENESKLTGLMKEVGNPDKFTDFAVKRGQGVATSQQKSSDAQSKIVSTTKGTAKNRPGALTSLLTSGDASGSTLLGG